MTNTERRVLDTISDQLGIDLDDITLSSNLVSDLGADSLDLVELVMALEENFNVEIDDAAADEVRTVQDAVRLIDRLIAADPAHTRPAVHPV